MQLARQDPDLRYLQRTPAGAEYVREITTHESDRRTRAAFQERVLTLAPRGGTLFDFGAGPGIDARFFAERGFRVAAYDADPRMREFFAEHCRDLIDAGRVSLDAGSYQAFLAPGGAADAVHADLVIADFAPLNLVDDLVGLFGRLATLTAPGGKVFASVLNPWLLEDMRTRGWWRAASRLWRDGERFMPGPQAPHYRRLLRHFHSACAPHFRLTRLFRDRPYLKADRDSGIDLRRRSQWAWLHACRCRYLFLLFEKTHDP